MKHICLMLLIVGMVSGCGGSSDDAPADIEDPAAVEDVEVAAAPAEAEAPAEPEAPAITLPAEISELVVLPEGLILTQVDVKDAGKRMYHIVGDTRDNPDDFQTKLIKVYLDLGWEEDMNMAQKNNTLTGFSHDGFMVYVEAKKGNIGSIVTIDTGNL